MAILVKKSLKYDKTITGHYIDKAGRILLIEIKSNNKNFVIGNVYAPTKDEPAFFTLFFNSCKFFKIGFSYRKDLESNA